MSTLPEHIPDSSDANEKETILSAFSTCVLYNPWIASQGAHKDLNSTLSMMTEPGRDYFADGSPITDKNRIDTVSMYVLQALGEAHLHQYTPVLSSPIAEGRKLTDHVSTVVAQTDIRFTGKFMQPLAHNAIQLFFNKPFEDTAKLSPLATVLQQRGIVMEEVFNIIEMYLALDDIGSERVPETEEISSLEVTAEGELIVGKPLPNTPKEQLCRPFYTQYISELNGSYNILMAYLEDIQTLQRKLE